MRPLAELRRAGRRVWRGAVLLVVLAVGAVALPAVAAADPPERFSESFTGVDPFLSELCGTEITISFTFRETTVYFEEGSELPHMHVFKFSATITGPGGSLIEREAWREYDTEETATVTGLPFRMLSPDGGVVIRDAGYVLFTGDDVSVVHGPHPALLEGFDICSYLV